MSKIFQAIEEITLRDAGERPFMQEMISCVGTEKVKLIEKQLLGKVEVYLQDVIDNMRGTLNDITASSFKQQSSMTREEWIKRDPA